jgi:hypothetical protein
LFARDGSRFHAAAHVRGNACPVEIVVNGAVVAAGEGTREVVVTEPGWVAARCSGPGGFAHTAPLVVGVPVRKPAAVAALRKQLEQVREWADAQGRYANPKRKQALLDRCAEAERAIGGGAL